MSKSPYGRDEKGYMKLMEDACELVEQHPELLKYFASDPRTTKNQEIRPGELDRIRKLNDFDLTMLISEIHDHGWSDARKLLPLMMQKDIK